MRLSRSRRGLRLLLVLLLGAVGLAGCGLFREPPALINYFIDAKLNTYNANTAPGRASGALMAFARVLPGFSYTSPNGGVVANPDIGTAEPKPGQGEEFTVRYVFNPKAVWSDGAPMTCDDLVLAWAALSGRLTGSQPASGLGYELISSLDCQKGAREATAVFEKHFPWWSGLFGAGTILPAHVLVKAAGVDVMDAVASGDSGQLKAAGKFWNSGWDLGIGAFEPARFPSSGPYRIESFDGGAATLTRNERWWGRRAQTPRIKVWQKGFRPPVAGEQVVDVGKGSIANLRLPEGLKEQTVHSLGIEQFVLSARGALASARRRAAFALCVPRARLAEDFGDHQHPAPGALADSQDAWAAAQPAPGRYAEPNIPEAYRARAEAAPSQRLVVRVGYLAPDARRAALVQAVAAACEPAGVQVVDASVADPRLGADFSPLALAQGQVDVALVSSDLANGAGGGAGPWKGLSSAAQVRSGEGEDVAGYTSSKLDDLVGQLALVDQEDERLQLLGQAQTAVWDDLAVIPLFAQPRSVIANTSVKGLVPNLTAFGAGWNMDRWSADE